jgi:hypothetical protein
MSLVGITDTRVSLHSDLLRGTGHVAELNGLPICNSVTRRSGPYPPEAPDSSPTTRRRIIQLLSTVHYRQRWFVHVGQVMVTSFVTNNMADIGDIFAVASRIQVDRR